MAETERHVEPEITEPPTSDSVEHRVSLYPITTENKRTDGETKDTRAPDNQRLQSSPHLQATNTQTDRVHRKSLPNNKLTLYLANRDLAVSESKIDKLQGVLLVDPEFLQEKRVYGQITLTFRYGREDEEVMGLKFCNEAVMCLAQLYPPVGGADQQETTPLQDALIKRLGPHAYPFTMEITPLAPPSVQLVPAKEYNGAPIGTSYDVRVYAADRADEKLQRKTTIRMGIRVIQRAAKPVLPVTSVYSVPVSASPSFGTKNQVFNRISFVEITDDGENTGPHATVEKPFLLSDGRVSLEAKLDRAVYAHEDSITVNVKVNNNSSKTVRRIKVFIVQHVDVCMFSNGKFKNVVALLSSQEGCPLGPGASLEKNYTLTPIKGSTKNWIALEDSYSKEGAALASTITCPGNGPEDRNVFAIYVSYYVKIKLLLSAMGGEVSLKLPFTLMYNHSDSDLGFPSPVREKVLKRNEDADKEQEDNNGHKYKGSKLEPIKEKLKESKDIEVDLIEHYEEGGST
ncbi:phosrestin-2-like isoform X2 [Ceratina calcarata]|uniref:Phosrestin-2-like isoform X2 n=1 Tax=Ceratina calcarata TaxID=156304 RepID=A0AAJ7S6U8_9HYME|nr:phosrestin-2-like isoform X2 [Ceratina calcarata]